MKSTIFKHPETHKSIKAGIDAINLSNTLEWLVKTPKHTCFRINALRKFDVTALTAVLEMQKLQCDSPSIPNTYFLKPDCLIVESWADEVKIEKSGNEVIVDVFCAAAVLRGANVYAPAVMGLPTGIQIGDKVDIYGDVEGKCKKGLKVPFEGCKIFVGTGILTMSRNMLFSDNNTPRGIAVETLLPASRLPVVNESLFSAGNVLLQNLPSLVCGWVLDAQPGDHILDMCAAPGNKTTHLAEMSNDKAHITAIDKSLYKVEKIRTNAKIHGITSIKSYVFDSTKCYSDTSVGINDGPPFPENSFDKILLDAPCSGLGQRPLLSNKMSPKMIESYKFVQRKLMASAAKILKVGGKLVYSTCTVTEAENEGIVAWTLKQFPCLRLIPSHPLLGGPGWNHEGLTQEDRAKLQRFGPENDSMRIVDPIFRDTIGFFIAAFTKVDDCDTHVT